MLDDYISIHHIHRKNTEDLGSSSVEEDFIEETPQIEIQTRNCGTQQASKTSEENLDYDDDNKIPAGEPHVIVIGGGPAGILTAIILRQRGVYVTVLEKMEVEKSSIVINIVFVLRDFSCVFLTHCYLVVSKFFLLSSDPR